VFNQNRIIRTIYKDKLFGFMTVGEIVKKSKLSKPTVIGYLRELSRDQKRQEEGGFLNPKDDMWRLIELEEDEMRRKGYVTARKPITHPMLLVKNRVYVLHPSTKIDLDNGMPLYVVSKDARTKSITLMLQRRGNRPEKSHSRYWEQP
jgi:hypothetical protein